MALPVILILLTVETPVSQWPTSAVAGVLFYEGFVWSLGIYVGGKE